MVWMIKYFFLKNFLSKIISLFTWCDPYVKKEAHELGTCLEDHLESININLSLNIC